MAKDCSEIPIKKISNQRKRQLSPDESSDAESTERFEKDEKKLVTCKGCNKPFKNMHMHLTRSKKNQKCKDAHTKDELEIFLTWSNINTAARSKKWRESNPDKKAASDANWSKNNPDKKANNDAVGNRRMNMGSASFLFLFMCEGRLPVALRDHYCHGQCSLDITFL